MNEPASPKTPEPDGRVIAAGTFSPPPAPDAPDEPAIDPIQASLREQAAIVQQGPPMRIIPRREVSADGTPKSNATLRRRAARDKE